jgi:hypothetical protein
MSRPELAADDDPVPSIDELEGPLNRNRHRFPFRYFRLSGAISE